MAVSLLERNLARRIVTNIPLATDTLNLTFVREVSEDNLKKELVADHAIAANNDEYLREIVHADTVFVLDEAWGVLGVGNDMTAKAFLAYLRKFNQYVIAPSVRPVHKELTYYQIARSWNARAALGIPVWLYRLEADGVVSSFWFRDFRVFHWYNTSYVPAGTFFVYERRNVSVETIKRERDKLNVAQFVVSLAFLALIIAYFFYLFTAPLGVSDAYQAEFFIFLPLVSN